MLHISPEGGYRLVTRQFTPDDYNLFRPKQGIEMEPANGQTPMPVTEQIITKLDGVEYVAPEEYKSYTDYLADFGKAHCKLAEPPVPEYSFNGRKSLMIGGHDWLTLSSDFNFFKNPFERTEFLHRAFDMFREPTDDPAQYFEKYSEFGKQTYRAAEELRQQIADGKGDSLFTLKTTFDLGGMKLTIGDLIHLHEGMKNTLGKIDGFENFSGFASLGMAVSSFKQYAKKHFSPKKQQQMVDYVEWRVQTDLLHSPSHSDYSKWGFTPNLNQEFDYLASDFDISKENTRSFNAAAYQKFSNIDLNDEQAFTEAVNWYLDGIKGWYKIAGRPFNQSFQMNQLKEFRSKFD